MLNLRIFIFLFFLSFFIVSYPLSAQPPPRFFNIPDGGIKIPLVDYTSLILDNEGIPWVIGSYTEYPENDQGIGVVKFNGDGFSELLKAGTTVGIEHHPSGVFDGQNRLWVVWGALRNNNWDIFYRIFDGVQWKEEMRLTTHRELDYKPKVAVDGSGGVWVTWESYRTRSFQVFAMHHDGKKWSQPEQISSNESDFNFRPLVVSDKKNRTWIVWDSFRQGNYDVYARYRSRGKWSKEIQITDTIEDEINAVAAADKYGNIWILAGGKIRTIVCGLSQAYKPREDGNTISSPTTGENGQSQRNILHSQAGMVPLLTTREISGSQFLIMFFSGKLTLRKIIQN